MQFLNDDMDELFRRAAEEYPLNVHGANWGEVEAKLLAQKLAPQPKNKKKNRRLLWLLLLPVGFLWGRYYNNYSYPPANKTYNQHITGTVNATSKPLSAANGQHENGAAEQRFQIKHNAGKTVTEGLTITSKEKDELVQAPFIEPGQNLVTETNDSAVILETRPLPATYLLYEKTSRATNCAATATPSIQPVEPFQAPFQKSNSRQHLYFSLVFGPDVSSVRYQQITKTGFSAGLLAGYSIGNRLAVEAGLLWDKKHYYAYGSYLDTSRLHLPAHSVVSDLKGSCNMFELPVNIKYRFSRNYRWFASVGLSSYIMKREDYDLYYKRYNTAYEKNYSYTNSGSNWLSLLNIGFGYQKPAFKGFQWSVGPYARVPLGKVGIGNLPISSVGVHIALSHGLQ